MDREAQSRNDQSKTGVITHESLREIHSADVVSRVINKNSTQSSFAASAGLPVDVLFAFSSRMINALMHEYLWRDKGRGVGIHVRCQKIVFSRQVCKLQG